MLCNTAHAPEEETISRDIDRTFPRHSLFAKPGGKGQRKLFNVLRAYSLYDPEDQGGVSYCQGMGFITAMLLSYTGEEDAFWILVSLMILVLMFYLTWDARMFEDSSFDVYIVFV